ncbi:glycoside hydrolase, partial [bacterium]|nr:glycoside hydrolase [bacterium]
QRYWQGPTWINTNWLIIEGLKNYGFDKEANELKEKTLKLVNKSGIYEYFDPLNGTPLGSNNFSWTAALAIDLINS